MTIAVLFIIGALAATQAPAAAQKLAAQESQLLAVIAKRPTDFAPYQQLASIYSMTGRRNEAEQVLRQALAVHQDSGAVFAALVSLHSKPQDPHKLLAIAEEWTRTESTNPQPLIIASQAHMALASAAPAQSAEAATHMDSAKRALEDAARLKASQSGSVPSRVILQGDRLHSPTPIVGYPNAVRVGGNVRMPRKIKDVKPVMPPAALEQRVQGVVILEVVINETGAVAEAKVLRSIPLLDEAALDAVKQWQFEPTEIEGKAVPVILTATVQFMATP